MNQTTYRNAGLKVFGLYGAKGELCDCGNEHCKALFKHPVASNWQYTPDWSDDQFETMHEMGQFDTGFGVLVSGLLVIDVDARNGGVDSFMDLCRDLGTDFLSESGFAVATGSGDGSMHLYFKLDETISLLQHHDSYEGIDFKSSGYVVGCGSLHKSGKKYTVIHGSPENITTASDSIIKLLKKPDTYRIKTGMGVVDMTSKEIADVLNHIDCDCDYDTWIKCGMAVHDALKGDGFEISAALSSPRRSDRHLDWPWPQTRLGSRAHRSRKTDGRSGNLRKGARGRLFYCANFRSGSETVKIRAAAATIDGPVGVSNQ